METKDKKFFTDLFADKSNLQGLEVNHWYKISWKGQNGRWSNKKGAQYLGGCRFKFDGSPENGWVLLLATKNEVKVYHQLTLEQIYPKQ